MNSGLTTHHCDDGAGRETGRSHLCPRPGYKHWSTVVLSLPSRGDMIMTASGGVQGKVSDVKECAGCNKKIHDKFVLKVGSIGVLVCSLTVILQAMDLYWHEDCLKCGCCDARLGEVGQSLYTKGNLLLCKRDYLRSD